LRQRSSSAAGKTSPSDPAGAFVKYLKVPASGLPQIVVHQEAADTWHIVLPAKPANADELPDADLERVAGGIPTPSIIATAIATASLISVASVATVSVSAGRTLDDGW